MKYGSELGSVRGQATVEFVLLLPLLAVIAAAVWQLVIVGQAVWLGGSAARAAAREFAVGGTQGQVERAARSVLPGYLEHELEVRRGDGKGSQSGENDGTVKVTLSIPTVLTDWQLTEISSRAHFEPQGGGA